LRADRQPDLFVPEGFVLRRRITRNGGRKYHRIERSYGSFVRTFSLPDVIEADKVKAEFKDGVLNLYLPKSEKAKPKAIEVKVA
jgi:HSP20 family protein